MDLNKKVYKDKKNAMLSGVCAGFAKYFNMDATLIRLLWAVLTVFGGSGIILYILCVLIIPDEPDGYTEVDYTDVNENK